jgi:hypothetical protein
MAELQRNRVLAPDGEVGKVCDAYFDDGCWMIRYLAADTSNTSVGHEVLVDSRAVMHIDGGLRTVWVSLPCARFDTVPSDIRFRRVRTVLGYALITVDGHVGQIMDFIFDDEIWTLRYLVVQMGGWLGGRRVLVNADRVRRVDWKSGSVEVNQTRNQIEHGWECDTDGPPPRDLEAALRTRVSTLARRH